MSQVPHRTSLYQTHIDCGAKIVEFAGWSMPINYGSQIKEHEVVRTDAGMFDVSHMCIIDVSGSDATPWLRHLLANDISKLTTVGQALYAGMLNDKGGVIDDMLVYLMQDGYRMVVNASNAEKDLAWMQATVQGQQVTIQARKDLAILAIQGPQAIDKLSQVKPQWSTTVRELKPFHGAYLDTSFVARTGYTGEDGVEVMLPNNEVVTLFNALKAVGVVPCGLGARDTLRLEAGMNLYGHEMDEDVSPLIANMGWTIAWQPADRDFIGRAALEAEKTAGVKMKQIGIVLSSRGVLRQGMAIQIDGLENGVITSGTFSPTLGLSIGIARVPIALTSQTMSVDLRGTPTAVQRVKMPFVRNGQKVYE